MGARWVMLPVVLGGVALALPARAGTLTTLDGSVYNGVVEALTETGVKFLWEKEKDQPEEIRKGQTDDLFRAQGHKAELRDIPFTSIAKIGGVPVDRFPSMFRYNLFFRTMQELEAGRIRMASAGSFYQQTKSAAVFLIAILVLVPLLLTLISTVLPGERLSFFGGVGFAFAFTLTGMGASYGSVLATSAFPALASTAGQVGLTAGVALLLALATHLGTRHSFWQGLAFTVTWGGSLFLAGRLAARLAGVGDTGVF